VITRSISGHLTEQMQLHHSTVNPRAEALHRIATVTRRFQRNGTSECSTSLRTGPGKGTAFRSRRPCRVPSHPTLGRRRETGSCRLGLGGRRWPSWLAVAQMLRAVFHEISLPWTFVSSQAAIFRNCSRCQVVGEPEPRIGCGDRRLQRRHLRRLLSLRRSPLRGHRL
jgi:hypothetical protein